MIYADIGPVSSGTLNPTDLLGTFEWELRKLAEANLAEHREDQELFLEHLRLCRHAKVILQILSDDEELTEDDDPDTMVDDLRDALQEYAPDYVYFTSNPGDPADIGFYPDIDQLEEDARHAGDVVLKIEAGTIWPRTFEAAARAAGWEEDDVGGCRKEAALGDTPDTVHADDWREACDLDHLSPELEGDFQYVMEVNDHGNVTLFARDGRELWSCV